MGNVIPNTLPVTRAACGECPVVLAEENQSIGMVGNNSYYFKNLSYYFSPFGINAKA